MYWFGQFAKLNEKQLAAFDCMHELRVFFPSSLNLALLSVLDHSLCQHCVCFHVQEDF